MADTRFLRSVQFGGYERSEVEERFTLLSEQIYSLKNELRAAKKIISAMEGGSDAAEALKHIAEDDQAKLSKMQAKQDAAEEKLAVAAEDLAAKDAEIAELKAQLLTVQDNLREQTEKLIGYEVNGTQALSAVFIEAQKSADLLVNSAKLDAAELEENSRKLAENTVEEANNTAKKIVHDAEVRAAQMLANAENQRTEFEIAAENVRAAFLADAERLRQETESLRTAFDSLRTGGYQALDASCAMLTEACEKAKAGGVPEFRLFIAKQPEETAAPVLKAVDHSYRVSSAADKEAKRQREEELSRLKAMADSIAAASAFQMQEQQPEKPAKTDGSAAKSPDLAALSALAASLDGDAAPEIPASGEQPAPADPGSFADAVRAIDLEPAAEPPAADPPAEKPAKPKPKIDLAALAAQAAALEADSE